MELEPFPHHHEVARVMVEMEHLPDIHDNMAFVHRVLADMAIPRDAKVALVMEERLDMRGNEEKNRSNQGDTLGLPRLLEKMKHLLLPDEAAPAMVALVNVPHDTLCRQAKHHIRLGSDKARIVLPPSH